MRPGRQDQTLARTFVDAIDGMQSPRNSAAARDAPDTAKAAARHAEARKLRRTVRRSARGTAPTGRIASARLGISGCMSVAATIRVAVAAVARGAVISRHDCENGGGGRGPGGSGLVLCVYLCAQFTIGRSNLTPRRGL